MERERQAELNALTAKWAAQDNAAQAASDNGTGPEYPPVTAADVAAQMPTYDQLVVGDLADRLDQAHDSYHHDTAVTEELADFLEEAHQDELDSAHDGDERRKGPAPKGCSYCRAIAAGRAYVADAKARHKAADKRLQDVRDLARDLAEALAAVCDVALAVNDAEWLDARERAAANAGRRLPNTGPLDAAGYALADFVATQPHTPQMARLARLVMVQPD